MANNSECGAYLNFLMDKSREFYEDFKANLKRLYIDENLSELEVSQAMGINATIIHEALREHKIRKSKEAKYKKISESRKANKLKGD